MDLVTGWDVLEVRVVSNWGVYRERQWRRAGFMSWLQKGQDCERRVHQVGLQASGGSSSSSGNMCLWVEDTCSAVGGRDATGTW